MGLAVVWYGMKRGGALSLYYYRIIKASPASPTEENEKLKVRFKMEDILQINRYYYKKLVFFYFWGVNIGRRLLGRSVICIKYASQEV